MNIKRYAIAAGISLAAHSALLMVTQQQKAFAMPAGAQSNAVSINFAALPQPKPAPSEPEAQSKTTPQETTTTKPKPPVEATKAVPKPVVKKPKNNKVIKQKVKPPQKVAREPVAKKPDPAPNKPEQKSKVEEVRPVPAPPTETQEKQVNSGVSSQPVLITRPSFLSRPSAPQYPRLARKRGIEGVALYEVWLDEEGKQVKQVLISSSGATVLDKSALEAIKQWEFSPHSVDGRKMAHRVQIPIRFKLD